MFRFLSPTISLVSSLVVLLPSFSAKAVDLFTPAEIEAVALRYRCRPIPVHYKKWTTLHRDLHKESGYVNRLMWFEMHLPKLAEFVERQDSKFHIEGQDQEATVIRTLLTNLNAEKEELRNHVVVYDKAAVVQKISNFMKELEIIRDFRLKLADTDKRDVALRAGVEENYLVQTYIFAREYDFCGLLTTIGSAPAGCYSAEAGISRDATGFPAYIIPDSGTAIAFDDFDPAHPLEGPRSDLNQSIANIKTVYNWMIKCVTLSAVMTEEDLQRAELDYASTPRDEERRSRAPSHPADSRRPTHHERSPTVDSDFLTAPQSKPLDTDWRGGRI